MRRIIVAVVAGLITLGVGIGIAQRPSRAQEKSVEKAHVTQTKPESSSGPNGQRDESDPLRVRELEGKTNEGNSEGVKAQQALRDELVEVRVREEILTLQRDAVRKQLQQQIQFSL